MTILWDASATAIAPQDTHGYAAFEFLTPTVQLTLLRGYIKSTLSPFSEDPANTFSNYNLSYRKQETQHVSLLLDILSTPENKRIHSLFIESDRHVQFPEAPERISCERTFYRSERIDPPPAGESEGDSDLESVSTASLASPPCSPVRHEHGYEYEDNEGAVSYDREYGSKSGEGASEAGQNGSSYDDEYYSRSFDQQQTSSAPPDSTYDWSSWECQAQNEHHGSQYDYEPASGNQTTEPHQHSSSGYRYSAQLAEVSTSQTPWYDAQSSAESMGGVGRTSGMESIESRLQGWFDSLAEWNGRRGL
ncbi:hypothetical protein I316_02872 [Kwoniella heveanensis BCC8398]|uniref:Uncharacterized protein n=1 Tax=Kwoniella heveanensis BCC8398 TaxID=1296120 RepID=A0A1B9GWC7_9TREE|nr:hypothetical protein I316_02872 [Kwoniella heveanensis BCC8398]